MGVTTEPTTAACRQVPGMTHPLLLAEGLFDCFCIEREAIALRERQHGG